MRIFNGCRITLLLLLAFLLSACTASMSEGQPAAKDKELTVYYLSSDPAAVQIISSAGRADNGISINAVAFNSVEEMDIRISTEVAGSTGADVILFSNKTTLDTGKMVKSGAFLDLTPFLSADAGYNESAYYPVFECAQTEGKQLLMPLRFRLQYLLTSQEKLEKAGLLQNGTQTTAQLFAGLQANAAACSAEESAMQSISQFDPMAHLYNTLRLTGVPLLDEQDKKLLISKDKLQEYADYGKMAYEQIYKSNQILQKYSRDFVGGVSRLTTMLSDTSLPFQMRYYDALFAQGLGQNLQIVAYPNNDDAGKLTADISLYAAIRNNTDQPQEAYWFVRFAMDASVGDITNDLSVSRKATEALLDELCRNKGKDINIGAMNVTISPMTEMLRLSCEDMLEQVGSGSIRNGVIEEIFAETMKGYITGEAAFDGCWMDFQNRAELYLYE